jgi:hypothetical protein
VDAPTLDDGEQELGRGVFGSVAWYVTLAQRIDPRTALVAVDGWGGDAYVSYERGDDVCIRIAFRGDRDADAAELAEALTAWVGEMPEGAASVERQGEAGVLLESCDPGDDASVPRDVTVEDLIVMPATRAAITASALTEGATEEQARCFGHEVVQEFSVDELLVEVPDAAMQQRISEVAAGCR